MAGRGLRLGLALAATLVALGSILAILRGASLWGPLAVSVIVLVGLAFERWRYRPLDTAPPQGFEPTGERFRDPGTGREVIVYVEPRTGRRRYVKAPPTP